MNPRVRVGEQVTLTPTVTEIDGRKVLCRGHDGFGPFERVFSVDVLERLTPLYRGVAGAPRTPPSWGRGLRVIALLQFIVALAFGVIGLWAQLG
jgi:hypothetical protein